MSFPRYERYKDSGVEWLGEVPEHWEVKRLKYLGEAIIGLTYDPSDIVGEEGALVLRSSNVQNGKIVFEDNVYVRKSIPEKLITKTGDILICSRNGSRALVGKNALIGSESSGLTFGAFMTIFRSRYNNYLFYIFNSSLFEFQSGSFLTSTVNQLTTGNLYTFEIPFPPIAEHKQITNFLDRETAKIDELIAEQQRLIELLKEKRQAVISHAVTKGLNPDVPMKDSGVEWLGEVPEHWEVKRLRFVALLNPSKSEATKLDRETEVSFLPMEAIGDDGTLSLERTRSIGEVEMGYTYFQEGDVTIAKITPCFENGKGAVMRGLFGGIGFGTTELIVARPILSHTISDYLHWIFISTPFRKLGQASMYGAGGQKRVPDDFVRNFAIAFPNAAEQKQITIFLDYEIAKIDTLTTEAQTAITLLQERRIALISSAVSGKIDVSKFV